MVTEVINPEMMNEETRWLVAAGVAVSRERDALYAALEEIRDMKEAGWSLGAARYVASKARKKAKEAYKYLVNRFSL